MNSKLWIWTIALLLFLPQPAGGEMKKKDDWMRVAPRQQGPGDQVHCAMIKWAVTNPAGIRSDYEIFMGIMEQGNGSQKRLFIVTAPKHLKGTALLIHAHADRPNEQWLYLNSRRRVKRIHSCFQSCKFLNSEWTYEDMGGHDRRKYTYQWIRDDTADGKICSLYEAVAKDNPFSAYFRQVRWIEKDTAYLRKVEYYDHKNELIKTLTVDAHKQNADGDEDLQRMVVVNPKTGKKMHSSFSRCRCGNGLEQNQFNAGCFHRTRIKGFHKRHWAYQ